MWPTERASRRGLIECVIASVAFVSAFLLLQRAGTLYLDKPASMPLFWAGVACLVVFGISTFNIAKRREYPWLIAVIAVALPFFDPTQVYPHAVRQRTVIGIRDAFLIFGIAAFIAQSMQRGDELERRIHLQALSWSFTIVVVLLLVQAMAADVLPPLRATWIAAALLISWVVAWFAMSMRYER